MLLLVFLGGVLTILSPCILPVVPLVFSRSGRSVGRELVPMLLGLAVAFTCAALIATTTARWLLVASAASRDAALLVLGLVGVTLLSTRAAEWFTRPMTRAGAALLGRRPPGGGSTIRNATIGAAIGLLWAPCAGPILGLVIALAAASGRLRATALFLTFALGAVMSLAIVTLLANRILGRFRRTGAADRMIRRGLGIATLATVAAIFLGWDASLFAGGGLVQTAGAEERLVHRLSPSNAQRVDAGQSLDDLVGHGTTERRSLATLDGTLPGFDGGTEWINSPPLTVAELRGKVVLVDFWTFACYNCLNALPHVKELYAKYKNQGFVVIGVHTPELARERRLDDVRREVKRLGITYPVVVDNDWRIWNAFNNRFWPAAYYADATGRLRFYHFGEGRYDEQDRVVAKLLAEPVVLHGAR
ncbi:MAG: hypothetical protein NVS4B3_01910 [Gemmatimonadaceae bacterium]